MRTQFQTATAAPDSLCVKIPKCAKPKDPSDQQVPKIAKKVEEKKSDTLEEPEVSDDEVDFYNDETFSDDEKTDKPSEACKDIVAPDHDTDVRPTTSSQDASSSSVDQNAKPDTVASSKELPPERDPKHYIDDNGM